MLIQTYYFTYFLQFWHVTLPCVAMILIETTSDFWSAAVLRSSIYLIHYMVFVLVTDILHIEFESFLLPHWDSSTHRNFLLVSRVLLFIINQGCDSIIFSNQILHIKSLECLRKLFSIIPWWVHVTLLVKLQITRFNDICYHYIVIVYLISHISDD